jgi:hypothetical protein
VCRGASEGGVEADTKWKPSGDMIDQVINNILAGRQPDDGVNARVKVKLHFAQSGAVEITATGEGTVDKQGVGDWTATLEAESGELKGGVFVGGEGKQVTTGGVTLTWTPGNKQRDVACYTYQSDVTFECDEKQPDKPPEDKPPPEVKPDPPREEEFFVFYNWAEANVLPKALPSKERLQKLEADGFRVVAIDGFASPEGSIPPKKGKFEGNDALSLRRAVAAQEWLKKNAAGLLTGSETLSGGSELYPQSDAAGKELEGDELTKRVAPEFAAKDPRAPKDATSLLAMRPQQQRDAIHPELRRARIRLRAPALKRPPVIKPPSDETLQKVLAQYQPVTCPASVLRWARARYKR